MGGGGGGGVYAQLDRQGGKGEGWEKRDGRRGRGNEHLLEAVESDNEDESCVSRDTQLLVSCLAKPVFRVNDHLSHLLYLHLADSHLDTTQQTMLHTWQERDSSSAQWERNSYTCIFTTQGTLSISLPLSLSLSLSLSVSLALSLSPSLSLGTHPLRNRTTYLSPQRCDPYTFL